MNPTPLVAGYFILLLLVGTIVVVVGYRSDRTSVHFAWDRFWHWWRVCEGFGVVGALGFIPLLAVLFPARSPSNLAVFDGIFFVVLVFAMHFFHWRLWMPAFGFGLPFRTYAAQTALSTGYALALAFGGGAAIFLIGHFLIP
jgi:hypothetical protein